MTKYIRYLDGRIEETTRQSDALSTMFACKQVPASAARATEPSVMRLLHGGGECRTGVHGVAPVARPARRGALAVVLLEGRRR